MQKVTKSTIKLFVLGSLLFMLIPFAQGQQDKGSHMLWKITSEEGTEGYLLGSIHSVKPDFFPLDEVYQQAFKKADIIAFEVNYDSMKTKAKSIMQKLAMIPKGTTLEDRLSDDTYQLLKTRLDSMGIPVARFQRMEPWFVASNLPTMQLQQAGFSMGVDQHFYSKAKESGKKRYALETVEDQLRLFSELSVELQEKFLLSTLDEAKENIQATEDIAEAWKSADIESIDRLLNGDLKKISEELYKRIVVERNRDWAPQIVEIINSEQTPLVVVGASHLVGNESLISLLIENGYQIEQI